MTKKIIRVAAIPTSLDLLLRGQLKFLNEHYEVIGVASHDKDIHNQIRQREGIETIELDIERKISPLKDIISLIKLYRLFKYEKPYIVHSLTPKAGLLSMTAAYFAGVPVRVHIFTGLIFPWKKGAMAKLLQQMDKLICHFATHIIPEGEGVKKDLLKYNITNKPLNVLARGNINGIDTDYYKRTNSSEYSDITRFIFVGRIVKDKGIEELHIAFNKLYSENSNIELIMVGWFEQELNSLNKDCFTWVKYGKGVRYVGCQDDIRPFLSEADIFIMPSHREGFPNTPIQAGAMSLPSIVTDICGCNEIVVDGETGILVPPRNAERLYEAMKRLHNNKHERKIMGENARKRVKEKFNREDVWSALLSFYQNV